MNRLFLLIILSTFLASCTDRESEKLRQNLKKEYSVAEVHDRLSSGSKAQYIQMERMINQTYIKDLDSLLNTGFDRQLEKFEDSELGVWSGYMKMFSWLFKSKQSWDDEMSVLSNIYFNPLDLKQEQNVLYLNYSNKLKNLRQQFLKEQRLPTYTQIDIPKEQISLELLSEHTRNNIVIEFGTELFEWFLGFIIAQIVLLFADKIAGPWGCLIDIFVFIVIIVISIIMTNHNDEKLLNSVREQHEEIINFDSDKLLEDLNENTFKFYERI